MSESTEIVLASGEIVPVEQEITPIPVEVRPADYRGASSSPVSREAAEILLRPFSPEELQILPTGEIYPPQVMLRRRLTEAFGPAGWALVPAGSPSVEGKTIAQSWQLWIGGRFVAESMGEADYYENGRTSRATAIESAKSNALMRCLKDLTVASECWDKDFCASWKAQYAEQARTKDGKLEWRKKAPRIEKTANPPEPLKVVQVSEKSWDKPGVGPTPWWSIRLSDGRLVSTFSSTIGPRADKAQQDNATVTVEVSQGKKGLVLDDLEIVE